MRLRTWDDATTKLEISRRFREATEARQPLEDRWARNERILFSTSRTSIDTVQGSLEQSFNSGMPPIDGSDADVNIAYTFKNFRFIHAQMSANPPSVVMRPNTSDQDDRRKADAADRVVRWALRKYSLQEKVDQLSLATLTYGSGFRKLVWDSQLGALLEYDPETDEMKMEGDTSLTIPFIWNMFPDPDARCWTEVKWVIERIYMDWDEAVGRWPGKEDILKAARVQRHSSGTRERHTQLDEDKYNSVELLEYYEKGLPTNGYLGRFCITTTDGSVLESTRPNPCRFTTGGAVSRIEAMDIPDDAKEERIRRLPEMAILPYDILTDIDVPNSIWGKSFVEYAAGLQDNVNRLDTSVLDNIQAHGVVRAIVPESADVIDDMTNSPWDILKISGNQPPYFMSPPQMMPDMSPARTNYVNGIDALAGVNEAMFGQQSREQSGASMQYATNQGNMIRRRLFNKYVGVVENLFRGILDYSRKHWTVERTIHVLGKENALEAIDLKGADLDGGYDVIGEYGVSLSLDPMTRREEILTLQPLFKEAGVPVRTSLKLLKLNELSGMFDKLDLADNRQKEIFDEIVATGQYIQPEEQMDHENMIAYALDWFMTSEFKYLDPRVKMLCKQHNKERIALAASERTAPAPSAPGPMPSAPAGPPPPVAPILPPIANG